MHVRTSPPVQYLLGAEGEGTMRLLYLLTFAVIPVLAYGAEKVDQTVLIRTEDKEMNDAIAKAQATLDDFLKIKTNPPAGASGFKIKVRITDAHGTEHMWVTPLKQTDTGFTGVLADEPEYITSVKNGQLLNFSRADVSDWGYVLNGKQKGSFTVCVVFKHMLASEVEQYRRDYGFEC
jgi:uncharacterized protein YegJ (DUF2314 family)